MAYRRGLAYQGAMEVTMKRFLILLALAACGTPQEQCIRGVSAEIATLDRLIAETERNLARGYGMERQIETRPEWVDCTPRPTTETPEPKAQLCFDDVPVEVLRPVALDLGAEEAKLRSMIQRRGQKAAELQPAIAACQARYPE